MYRIPVANFFFLFTSKTEAMPSRCLFLGLVLLFIYYDVPLTIYDLASLHALLFYNNANFALLEKQHHPYWAGLSDYSRMAATVLGYDQNKWDESEELPIFQKALHELTHEERSASTVLWLDSYFKETHPKDLPGKDVADEIVRDPNNVRYRYAPELSLAKIS